MSELVVWKLTGRYRHRQGWFGKLILQVETYTQSEPLMPRYYAWRDATAADLAGVRAGD